jgi:hypothetical protein
VILLNYIINISNITNVSISINTCIILAAVLSLPSRELAIVAFHDVPTIKHSGAYKIDVSLYLDRKNKPAEKTSLIFAGDVNVDKNIVAINGEAKFTYPSQTKVKRRIFSVSICNINLKIKAVK